jgi:hypothetical protein
MIFALFLPANALEVEITSGCLYLDDLYGADYPHTSVQCGIKAGEKKAVAPQSIATALKRASLPYDAAIPPATVIRKGGAVSEQRVLNDIHKLFAARYPNFEIKVDYVRFGRELFSEDPLTYELELDMQRFGVSNGVIRTGYA